MTRAKIINWIGQTSYSYILEKFIFSVNAVAHKMLVNVRYLSRKCQSASWGVEEIARQQCPNNTTTDGSEGIKREEGEKITIERHVGLISAHSFIHSAFLAEKMRQRFS